MSLTTLDPTAPQIPDYQVLRRIGRGAYGEVWLVRSVTGLYRAAKIVWRDRFNEDAPYEREFRAIEHYARICLEDPRLLRVLHVGKNAAAKYFYYLMELADDAKAASPNAALDVDNYTAHSLRYQQARQGFLPSDEILRLGVDLARALQSLHQQGLIHRDIKPSNIIYVGGLPKLGDVGLVTEIRENVTQVGTPGYVPPEGPGKPSADVFALGKVLYEMASGKPADKFPILSNRQISAAELPRWRGLNEIILKAADKRLEVRYPTAQKLLNDLLLVEAGTSIGGWMRLRRQARWLKLAALILLTITGVAIFIAQLERRMTADAQAKLKHATERLRHANYTGAQLAILAKRHRAGRSLLEQIPNEDRGERPLEWRMLYRLAYGSPDQVYQAPPGPFRELTVAEDGSAFAALAGTSIWMWDKGQTNATVLATNVAGLGPFTTQSPGPLYLEIPPYPHANNLTGIPGVTGTYQYIQGSPASRMLLLQSKHSTNLFEFRSIQNQAHAIRFQLPWNKSLPETKLSTLSIDGTTFAVVRFNSDTRGPVRPHLEVFDVRSNSLKLSIPLDHDALGISISHDGSLIALANGTAGPPQILNTKTRDLAELRNSETQIKCDTIALSPDGTRVATAGTDGIIQIWDTDSLKPLEALVGHAQSGLIVAWSADGNTLFSGDSTGEFRRWRMISNTRVPNHLSGFWSGSLGNLALGNASPIWAITHTNGNVGVRTNTASQSPDFVLPDSFEPICFSDGDNTLWTYDRLGWVRSWDLATRTVLSASGPLLPTNQTLGKVVVDPANQLAFGVSYSDGDVFRWNLRSNRLDISLTNQLKPNCYMLEYLAGPASVFLLESDGSFHVLNAANLAPKFIEKGTPMVTHVSGLSTSPNGRWAAAGSESGRIRVYDTTKNQIVDRIGIQQSPVVALVFTRDSKSLIASHTSNALVWLDLATGQERVVYSIAAQRGTLEEAPAFRLGITPNDELLVAFTNDSEILRWQAWKSPPSTQ